MKKEAFKIEWDAHEYEHKERSSDWFWAVGIVAFAIAITAVIFGNLIFGILVITGAFALALFINREPETVHVVIDERGVSKGKVRYPYESLQSFWIDADHSHPKIMLRSEKFFLPLIIVPLSDEVDPEEIANTLEKNLTERHHTLPLLERMLEYLGF